MKKIKVIVSLAISMFLLNMLSGCGLNDENIEENIEISYNLEFESEEKEIIVKKFNLGEGLIKEREKNIPFDIEGILGMPKIVNEKTPIVFIFHGQHSADAKKDFEDGFIYLVENFAKNGIIAISVDDQINHTWEYGEPVQNERLKEVMQVHLENIIKANDGDNINYGVDLKGKIDLDNIGLVGHSMCGQGVFEIAKEQQNKGFNGIKGILSLTPSNNEVIEKYPDINTAIVVSEYDGDVMDSGASIYDEILEKGNRNNPLLLTYLIGGNHNSFNTIIENNKEMSTPQTTNGSYLEKLTNEEQRDFIMKYAVDFMKGALKSEPTILIENDKAIPNTMYGYKVLNKIDGGDSEILLDAKKFKIEPNEEIKVDTVIESFIPNKDELELFSALGYKEEIELIKLDWKEKNSSIRFNIADLAKKSEVKGVKFRWALDSTDKSNSINKEITLKVKFIDKEGKRDSVVLGSDTSALKYFEGEIIKTENFGGTFSSSWSRKTPIMDTLIPKSIFKDVDLANLANIEIECAETGSLLLEEIAIIYEE